MATLDRFCLFHGTLKFAKIGRNQIWWTIWSLKFFKKDNNERSRTSAWKLIGWCSSTWGPCLWKNNQLEQYLCIWCNYEICHDRHRPGLRDNSIAINDWRSHVSAWKISGLLHSTPTKLQFNIVLFGPFLCPNRTVIFHEPSYFPCVDNGNNYGFPLCRFIQCANILWKSWVYIQYYCKTLCS